MQFFIFEIISVSINLILNVKTILQLKWVMNSKLYVILKILITALVIVIITEVAKLNDRIGGLIAALPITTFIILFWLYYEGNSVEKISNHASYTLLYVLPTLPMFLVFPYLINKFGFYWSIFISVLLTTFLIIIVHFFSKKYGFKLL